MKATLIIIFFGVSNFLFGQIQDSTTLYFQIIPGQCEIKIDGIKVPHTSKTMLAQGEHRIVVWKSGFHLFDTTLTVSGQNQIILKKRLAIRDDYRVFEKASNKYQFKRLALNRGIPIASGACLGVAFYSMFAARKNVVNGQKIYDEYLKVVGADEVIYLKESYENERSMQKKNQRNAIIFGSVGAALGATSIYIFKKVKSTKPVYVDPGAVEFDSASLNYQSGGLMCSINFRLR